MSALPRRGIVHATVTNRDCANARSTHPSLPSPNLIEPETVFELIGSHRSPRDLARDPSAPLALGSCSLESMGLTDCASLPKRSEVMTRAANPLMAPVMACVFPCHGNDHVLDCALSV